jgi:5'-nucleotidase (lipoprotein e(P4) family)
VALAASVAMAAPAWAQGGPNADDNLNAVLWTQRSVEFKGNSLTAFALAKIRLDQALADKSWTAAPGEQKGDYQNLPPAVVLDVDETLLDNSAYQAWTIIKSTSFEPKTWTSFVNAKISIPIPGAVDFTKYAASKGVKVFYVSNRTAEEKPATVESMKQFGFPTDSAVDTFLFAREKPDWGSAKSVRRLVITKDYRVILNIGDNFGDFSDAYRGTEEERQKVFDENKDRWGREWIVIANPTYGSFESAPFKHDFKKSDDEKRKNKRDVLWFWDPK